MHKVTRQEIIEARARDCGWTEDILRENIERRFPGGDPIALADLIDAWLADKELSLYALGQASFLAGVLAPAPPDGEDGKPGRRSGGSFTRPREALERIKQRLPE